MHAHLPTLTRESTVRDAVDKMDVYQFPALVVLDEEQHPIGVVTEGDLCRAVVQRDSLISMATEPVYVYCSKEPTVGPAEMEIGDAFHRMLNSGLTILPVTDEEKFVGMVLRVDLMQALLLDASQPPT